MGHIERSLSSPQFRLAGAVGLSICVSSMVMGTAWGFESPLGAPTYWTWLLTGLQVTALWAAGRKHWSGWLLGAAVQPPWIVYAILTDQLGFIPGCAISAVVQTLSYLKTRAETKPAANAFEAAGQTRMVERVRVSSQHVVLHGVHRGSGPGRHPDLGVDVLDVAAHGLG